jgi:hypothetical protein
MESYTNKDFNSLYQTVRKELIQNVNYDISKDKKYTSLLNGVVNSVKRTKNGSAEYINSLVVHSVIPKFSEIINKSKNPNAYNPPVNSPVNTGALPRPMATKQSFPEQANALIPPGADFMKSLNKNDEFSKMCNQSSRNDVPTGGNMSALDKFEELKRERGFAGANDEFNKSREIADSKARVSLDSYNQSKSSSTNEFFKNLYENNISENSPFSNNKEEKITINRSIVHEPLNSNQKQDPSTANEIPENKDRDISDLKETNNLQKQYDQFKTDSTELYRNTNFTNPRENGKIVILDTGNLNASAVIDFRAVLVEPVIIDRIADVFIEFITIQNLILGGGVNHLETVNLFALNIKELPTQIGTTNADFIDKYIFPNETFGTSDIGGESSTHETATTYTIKLKSNYLTTINANKFTEFKVTLQGLVNDTLENIESSGNGRVTIGLFIKKR